MGKKNVIDIENQIIDGSDSISLPRPSPSKKKREGHLVFLLPIASFAIEKPLLPARVHQGQKAREDSHTVCEGCASTARHQTQAQRCPDAHPIVFIIFLKEKEKRSCEYLQRGKKMQSRTFLFSNRTNARMERVHRGKNRLVNKGKSCVND